MSMDHRSKRNREDSEDDSPRGVVAVDGSHLSPTTTTIPTCPQGSSCPQLHELNHRLAFFHSGYRTNPIKCRDGAGCSQLKDPTHLVKYAHDLSQDVCKLGAKCPKLHLMGHRRSFFHKNSSDGKVFRSDPIECRDGMKCSQLKDRAHLMKYAHSISLLSDGDNDEEEEKRDSTTAPSAKLSAATKKKTVVVAKKKKKKLSQSDDEEDSDEDSSSDDDDYPKKKLLAKKGGKGGSVVPISKVTVNSSASIGAILKVLGKDGDGELGKFEFEDRKAPSFVVIGDFHQSLLAAFEWCRGEEKKAFNQGRLLPVKIGSWRASIVKNKKGEPIGGVFFNARSCHCVLGGTADADSSVLADSELKKAAATCLRLSSPCGKSKHKALIKGKYKPTEIGRYEWRTDDDLRYPKTEHGGFPYKSKEKFEDFLDEKADGMCPFPHTFFCPPETFLEQVIPSLMKSSSPGSLFKYGLSVLGGGASATGSGGGLCVFGEEYMWGSTLTDTKTGEVILLSFHEQWGGDFSDDPFEDCTVGGVAGLA